MGNGTSAPLLVNPLKTYYGARVLRFLLWGVVVATRSRRFVHRDFTCLPRVSGATGGCHIGPVIKPFFVVFLIKSMNDQ